MSQQQICADFEEIRSQHSHLAGCIIFWGCILFFCRMINRHFLEELLERAVTPPPDDEDMSTLAVGFVGAFNGPHVLHNVV